MDKSSSLTLLFHHHGHRADSTANRTPARPVGQVGRAGYAVSFVVPGAIAFRYQVKRFLGEGGKKKVYLTHDTTQCEDESWMAATSRGL